METIQNCLGQLIFLASGQQHSSLSTPSAGDEKKLWRLLNPRDIIQDLKNSCFNEIPDDQLGICASLVLQSKHSVLNFLQSSVTSPHQKEQLKAREDVFVFLAELTQYLARRNLIQHYVVDIKDCCIDVFRKEELNRSKAAAFAVLDKLFDLKELMAMLDAEQLRVGPMVHIFITEFSCNKCSSTVKGKILEMLGRLSHLFPFWMCDYTKQTLSIFLITLKKQFQQKKPDLPLIEGALNGLSEFLHHFEGDFADGHGNVQDLFHYITLALSPPPELTRYGIPKAACRLIITHGFLLRRYLTETSKASFQRLLLLCNHSNNKLRKLAYRAMDAFLLHVANELTGPDRSAESNVETFKFFVKTFREMMDSSKEGITSRDITVAVLGLGRFARPFAEMVGQDQLQNLLLQLFHYASRFFQPNPDGFFADALHYLPSFVNSFASIILHLDELDNASITHLEKLLVALFVFFPQFHDSQRMQCGPAFSRLLLALHSKPATTEALFSRVLFQGLTLTCSNSLTTQIVSFVDRTSISDPPSSEASASQNQEGSEEEPFYVQYVSLWKAIIYPIKLSDVEIEEQLRQSIMSTVFSVFIRATLSFLSKLDLSYQTVQVQQTASAIAEASLSATVTTHLRPNHPNDYELLENFVEFSQKLFVTRSRKGKIQQEDDEEEEEEEEQKQYSHFRPWIYVLGKTIIALSNRQPLVSGFYKLFSQLLSIANTLGFFVTDHHDDQFQINPCPTSLLGASELPLDSAANKRVCKVLFSKFLHEILQGRLKQFKDELLMSCINLVLLSPKELLSIEDLIPAIQVALSIGLRFVDVAHAAFSCLESWFSNPTDAEIIKPHLQQILPLLEPFLQVNAEQYQQSFDSPSLSSSPGSSTASITFVDRRFEKTVDRFRKSAVKVQSEAARLQQRILVFLGQLGCYSTQILSGHPGHRHTDADDSGEKRGSISSTTALEKAIAWDSSKRVLMTFRFRDLTFQMYIDPLLPRIVELAEDARDRQAKVVACELLHSIILYMIGTSANHTFTKNYRLYEKMFPSLIRLANDVDLITRQLFEPLVFQLIRWFTRNLQAENEETMNLLDAIYDAIGSATDGALREFASRCLAQFCLWSIKNSPSGPEQSAAAAIEESSSSSSSSQRELPINISSIFKRLYSLAHHPDPYRRLGSSLTLLRICEIIRSEDVIVNLYIFDLLDNALFSLRLAEYDDSSLGTATAASTAVDRLAQLLLGKLHNQGSTELLKKSSKRKAHAHLSDFVDWMFCSLIVRQESHVTTISRQLFLLLVPFVSTTKASAATEWMHKKIYAGSIRWLLETVEPTGTLRLPKLQTASIDQICHFFVPATALGSFYSWAFSNALLTPEQVLSDSEKSSTRLFRAYKSLIQLVLTLLPFSRASSASRLLGKVISQPPNKDAVGNHLSEVFSSCLSSEFDEFHKKQSTSIHQMFKTIIVILTQFPDSMELINSFVTDRNFILLLLLSLLTPKDLGFDPHPIITSIKEPVTSTAPNGSVISTLAQLIPAMIKYDSRLQKNLEREISLKIEEDDAFRNHFNIAQVDFFGAEFDVAEIQSLTVGYRVLLTNNVLPRSISAKILGAHVAQSVFQLTWFDANVSKAPLSYSATQAGSQQERQIATQLTPTQLIAAQLLLNLSFDMGLEKSVLIDMLLNEELISESSSMTASAEDQSLTVSADRTSSSLVDGSLHQKKQNLTVGEQFFQRFSNQIVQQLLDDIPAFLPLILESMERTPLMLRVFLALCDQLAASPHLEDKKSLLIQYTMDKANRLESWCSDKANNEHREAVAQIVSRLLRLNHIEFLFHNGKSLTSGQDFCVSCVCTMLQSAKHSLTVKNEVLELLVLLFSAGASPHLSDRNKILIRETLSKLVQDDFPVRSRDLLQGSALSNEYSMAVDRLLKVLVASKQSFVLDALLPILSEENHLCQRQLDAAMQNLVASLTDREACQMFEFCSDLFLDDSNPDYLRLYIVKALCVPILSSLNEEMVLEVFSQRIQPLTDMITSTTNPVQQLNLLETTESRAGFLLNQMGAMLIIRALFDCLSSKSVKDHLNPIFCKKASAVQCKGNELTSALMKSTHIAKSCHLEETVPGVDQKLVLAYHQSAFNALAAVIACTQSKDSFFTLLLFKENREKGERLWSNIIDTTRPVELPVITKFPILHLNPDQLRGRNGQARPQYISSQFVGEDSSLAREVGSYVSTFFQSQMDSSQQSLDPNQAHRMEEISLPGKGRDQKEGAQFREEPSNPYRKEELLEMDPINSNPCMISLLKVIDKMVELFGVSYHDGEAPEWSRTLLQVVQNSSFHINIRLFVVKIILNRAELFSRWRQSLLSPVIEFCLDPAVATSDFHYFLRDVCITVLSKFQEVEQLRPIVDESVASQFVNHLISVAHHPQSEIVKSNIDIIKLFTERWKSYLVISKKPIIQLLTSFDQERSSPSLSAAEVKVSRKRTRVTGMQLLGVLLANQFPLYHSITDAVIDEVRFLDVLIGGLSFESRSVNYPCAEVIGMALQQVADKKPHHSSLLSPMVIDLFSSYFSRHEYDKVFPFLSRVSLHCPSFVDHFSNRVLSVLPNLMGEFRRQALQLILLRSSRISDLPLQLRAILPNLLQHRDSPSQLTTLQIVGLIADQGHFASLFSSKATEVSSFIKTIRSTFCHHDDEDCRQVYFDVLIKIYHSYADSSLRHLTDNDSDEEEMEDSSASQPPGLAQELPEGLRLALLEGLTDKSDSIRQKTFDFWHDKQRLSMTSTKRLLQLFSLVYFPEIEDDWLHIATDLLLKLSENSPDYESFLFQPLNEKSEFFEYDIASHAFNQSQPASLTSGNYSASLGDFEMMMMMMMSDDGSSLHTSTSSSMPISLGSSQLDPIHNPFSSASLIPHFPIPSSSEKQLLGQMQSRNNNNKSMIPSTFSSQSEFKQPLGPSSKKAKGFQSSSQLGGLYDYSEAEGQSKLRVRTRFLVDQPSVQQKAITAMKHRKLVQDKRLRIRQDKRMNCITIHRKYRRGELPDIQIKPRDIIVPFVALAKKDTQTAALLFSHLVNGIVCALPQKERVVVLDSLQKSIAEILCRSSHVPSFVSSLLSVCFSESSDRLELEPETVANVASLSRNLHPGIMVLEKQMLKLRGYLPDPLDRQPTKQRAKAQKKLTCEQQKDQEETSWMQTTKLYKALGDDDILLGIYQTLFDQQRSTKEALIKTLEGDHLSALKIFERAIQQFLKQKQEEKAVGSDLSSSSSSSSSNPSEMELAFWQAGKLECLHKLCQWEPLYENTLAQVDGTASRLLQPQLRDPLLGFFISSCLKQGKYQPLLELLRDTDEESGKMLERHYGWEMAALAISNDDFDRARYHITINYQEIASRWASLHPLATTSKRKLLEQTQKVVEIDEFLQMMSRETNFSSTAVLERLLGQWRSRLPSLHFSISTWDDIVRSREMMLQKILDRFCFFWLNQSSESEACSAASKAQLSMSRSLLSLKRPLEEQRTVDPEEIRSQLRVERGTYFVQMGNAARKMKNFSVAEQYLKLFKEKSGDKHGFSFDWLTCLIKLYCTYAKNLNSFSRFDKALSYLNDKQGEPTILENPMRLQKYHMLKGSVLHSMARIAQCSTDVTESLSSATLSLPSKSVDSHLFGCAFKEYSEAVELNESSGITTRRKGRAAFKFAMFCSAMLKRHQEVKSEEQLRKSKSCVQYAQSLVHNILYAMSLGSTDARERFPKVLQLLSIFPLLQDDFSRSTLSIPSWMFIRWTSQMLGVLDREEGRSVLPLLLQLAREYPQALVYAVKISSEGLKAEGQKLIEPVRKQLEELRMIDQFIACLESLTHPEHRFKEWVDGMRDLVRGGLKNREQIKEIVKQIKRDVFDVNQQPTFGHYNKKFAVKWAEEAEKKFNVVISSLTTTSEAGNLALLRPIDGMIEEMRKELLPRSTAKMKLNEFNTWLARFDASNLAAHERPEIPGQYNGLQRPIPPLHVLISSFDGDLLVMGSIRRPKRLKIRGNDQRDHPYLVKGGEDLRLDQRVQQLFSVMNQLLQSDPETARRHLAIKTYQVVPMTTKVGLIEWLDNTKPLKAIIEDELEGRAAKSLARSTAPPASVYNIQEIKAAQIHRQWIESFGSSLPLPRQYAEMFQRASRVDTIQKVQKQLQTVPWDLLRNGIMNLCSSPEAYLSIRSHFARTLASFSMASYIVGIGDRHLENFLLDLKTGGLVGIDFGHAFGTATQFLPIPELIPFRLTPQFTNFLQPLSSEGLLFHNMCHSISTFRAHKDVLLSTMEVFINEPLLDWEKFAQKLANSSSASTTSSSSSAPTGKPASGSLLSQSSGMTDEVVLWYGNDRLRVAEQKLEGVHPSEIMAYELRTSLHKSRPYIEDLQQIVRGNPEFDKRAQLLPKKQKELLQPLTVDQQVDCLIDLATDPAVLGRIYRGWAHWI